jgi:hypothetical protein
MMTNRFAVISAIGAIVFMASTGLAGAYSVASGSMPQPGYGNAFDVSLPSLPSGTFSPNWNGFLNDLPIQPFLNSLHSIGGTAAQSIQNVQTTPIPTLTTVNNVNGQGIMNQIDGWTQQHLGFQLSGILGIFLGLLSWVLGLAKNIVDWLLNLVGGK